MTLTPLDASIDASPDTSPNHTDVDSSHDVALQADSTRVAHAVSSATPQPARPAQPGAHGAPESHESPEPGSAPSYVASTASCQSDSSLKLQSDSSLKLQSDLSVRLQSVSVVLRRGEGQVVALRDIDCRFDEGEFVGVIGDNGSGKSTLAKVIAGLTDISRGEVTRPDVPIRMVLQNPDAQIVGETIWEDLAFGMELAGISAGTMETLAQAALLQVGLTLPLGTPVAQLSGGEKQLLCIAAALVTNPRFIVFDEVTASLNPLSRNHVLETVRALHQSGVTVIYITQFPDELIYADRVLALYEGSIRYNAPTRPFLYEACASLGYTPPYVVQVAQALIRRGLPLPTWPLTPAELSPALADGERTATGEVQPATGGLAAAGMGGPEADREANREMENGKAHPKRYPSVSIECLSLSVSAPRPSALVGPGSSDLNHTVETLPTSARADLLHDVSLSFHPGEITLLIGRTGAGKSTLLRTLAGLVRPTGGSLAVDGETVWRGHRVNAKALDKTTLLFQSAERQLFRPTVDSEFEYSLRPYRLPAPESVERQRAALSFVRLSPALGSANPRQLSGGQQRRVALATTIATRPRWFLLDEPTSGLDGLAVAAVRDWAVQTVRRGGWGADGAGVIVATHDLDAWLPVADKVVVLSEGRVVWSGLAKELSRHPEVLMEAGVGLPSWSSTTLELAASGWNVPMDCMEADTLADAIVHQTLAAGNGEPRTVDGRPHGTGKPLGVDGKLAHSRESGSIRRTMVLPLHTLNPQAKWLAYAALSVVLLFVHTWALLPATVIVAALYTVARVPLSAFWRFGRVFLVFMVFAVLFAGVTWHSGDNSMSMATASATESGTAAGPANTLTGGSISTVVFAIAALFHNLFAHIGWTLNPARVTLLSLYRILLILVLGIIFTETTSTLSMKTGLHASLQPLARIGVPVEAFAFGSALVLRFIPLLSKEASRLAEIAQVRGKRYGKPGRIRLKDAPTFLLPLLFSLFQLGEELAFAMEARGLTHFGGRRPLQGLPRWITRDYLAIAITTLVALLLLAIPLA